MLQLLLPNEGSVEVMFVTVPSIMCNDYSEYKGRHPDRDKIWPRTKLDAECRFSLREGCIKIFADRVGLTIECSLPDQLIVMKCCIINKLVHARYVHNARDGGSRL